MAGVNLLFDSDFMDGAVNPPVRIQCAAIFDALNTLSTQTHNFVEVLDNQSIIVAPDNPAKHSLYDSNEWTDRSGEPCIFDPAQAANSLCVSLPCPRRMIEDAKRMVAQRVSMPG